MNEKSIIVHQQGQEIEADCAFIISASRLTDIPAFHT